MGMGGNPYGPAGTGKTESVKALGGLFGRQVLVFNCDEVYIYKLAFNHTRTHANTREYTRTHANTREHTHSYTPKPSYILTNS